MSISIFCRKFIGKFRTSGEIFSVYHIVCLHFSGIRAIIWSITVLTSVLTGGDHMLIKLIIEILVGAIIGSIAGKIMDKESKGFVVNAVLGIVGGAVGGWIGNLLGIGGGWLSGLILSVVGACLVIYIIGKLK